jgi:hypothetical protein
MDIHLNDRDVGDAPHNCLLPNPPDQFISDNFECPGLRIALNQRLPANYLRLNQI